MKMKNQNEKSTEQIPKKKKKKYFTEMHEQAVLDFVSEDDFKKREEIYVCILQPVFKEMIDKIVYTYRYITLPNIDMLKEECQTFLVTILDKYKRPKGSAFSYFSVVTKNWFIHKKKKLAMHKEINYEDVSLISNDARLSVDFTYEDDLNDYQFWTFLRNELEKWDDSALKFSDNELTVISAIKTLFDNIDELDIITRKSVYLYLREITDLPTKKIVVVLTKLRKKYYTFRKKWNNEIF